MSDWNAASSSLLVRAGRETDAPLLPDVERSAAQAFLQVPGLEWIAADDVTSEAEHRAAIRAGASWVAEISRELVGFAVATEVGDALHLEELSVRFDAQGRGVGAALMRNVIDFAVLRRRSVVTLTTFRDLPFNEAFYSRFGFLTLTRDRLSARLRDILSQEELLGMPPDRRCAMSLNLEREKPGGGER
ncbi:GNAT family N-acetyltransferase [Acetobacter nitrogenifigens]|uniref:N-acetyltransferase n=1 Tax=Acetobacter nitrogenifigens DSM 23921 = NBRC 105050 TaxID=1120919 RepID=A0A511XB04_9PROT|nr:GNAT family N-acetyltransferase [Acetobacter nitrogenifigens]GEN60126.1 N-acetyltransferase [Acetobacter nitrogenifigens DSM 23921 = NBRC 105050]